MVLCKNIPFYPHMQYNIYYAQKDYITTCSTVIHATGIVWDGGKKRRKFNLEMGSYKRLGKHRLVG